MCRWICSTTLAISLAIGLATESQAEPPTIYRGLPDTQAAKSTIVRRPAVLPEQARPKRQVFGGSGDITASGNRLWLVDRDRGTITACRLVGTLNVGQKEIQCFKRQLRGLKRRRS